MVGNLAPLIPALFTGPNGERLTADQIKRRQEIAESLMAQATDTSPNAGGWASILAKGVQGFAAGRERRSADNASSTNAAESQKRLSSMLGIFTGGAPASSTTPSIGGLPPAVSTGAGAELAATSPGVATNIDMSGNELYSSFIDTVRQGGLTNPYGLAAVAATGKAESGWSPQNATRTWSDPSESGQPGTAGGIMSWRGPRYQALAATGDLSPQGQARFFLQEDPNLIAKLNSAKSLEEAQSAINQAWAFAGYDRPGGEAARRLSYAQGYLPMFQGQGEVAALTPQGAIEAVAPAAGGQPPAFDAGRFGDPIKLAEMPPSASTLPSSLIDQGSNYVPAPPMTAPPREIAAAPSVAQALVQPSAPVAPPVQMAQPSIAQPQINPVVIEALTSQYASPEERQVAQMLFSDFQQEKDRAEKQALAQQQRAAEIARRQAIAQQTGIDPSYAADDDIWKGAAGNLFAAPSTTTMGNAIIDNRTGLPIYEGEPERQPLMNLGDGTVYDPNAPQDQRFIQAPNSGSSVPDSVRALEIRAERAGLQPGTPEYNQFMISGGSGGTSLSVGPDGTIQFSQGGGRPLTEAQGKDSFFAARMQSSMPTLDKYENALMSLPEAAAGALPAGRYLQSEEYQLAKDAGDDFVATYLRKDSGAALTKEERSQYGEMLLPQPGDKPAVIQAKKIRRQVAAQAIQLGLPKSAVDNMVKAVGSVEGAGEPTPTSTENPLPPQTNGRKTSTGATWEVLD